MIAAACVALLLNYEVVFSGNNAVVFAKTSLITAGCTTIAWLAATFLTPPEPQEKLVAFYRRVHPAVYGWRHIAKLVPELLEVRDMGSNAFAWVMGCLMIYCSLFGKECRCRWSPYH